MSSCPHYLELATGVPDALPQIFACDLPLGHPKKHRHNTGSWGRRPLGGKPRRAVAVRIKWDR